MNLLFYKMNMLGNDFVVIDNVTNNFSLDVKKIKFLSNRNFGVGCDQLLVLTPPSDENHDFDYYIYNSDGSESGQCGNGALCISKFISQKKLNKNSDIKLKTISTSVYLKNNFVDLGKYYIDTKFNINIKNISINAYKITIGNPHIIVFLDNTNFKITDDLVQELDKKLFNDNNVSFIKHENNEIKIRTYERGVGLTLSCGSASCAASIACHDKYALSSNTFKVHFEHGYLNTEINLINKTAYLSGEPEFVFKGRIII